MGLAVKDYSGKEGHDYCSQVYLQQRDELAAKGAHPLLFTVRPCTALRLWAATFRTMGMCLAVNLSATVAGSDLATVVK